MANESLFHSPDAFVADPDFVLYVGDVRDTLARLPEASIDCCVTSPPYWGLRDYGTGSWEGGDPDCQHRVGGQVEDSKARGAITTGVRPGVDASRCLDCGAVRVDRQMGLEPSPDEYVEQMVAVFAEVRRALKPEGTLWLNLGDSYAGSWGAQSRGNVTGEDKATISGSSPLSARQIAAHPRFGALTGARGVGNGIKPKDLVGIPWMVAFALRADGWYLRAENIWRKSNPMPESVRDRPTRAHEQVFLFSKSPRYFYDADAVAEPATWYGPNGQPKKGPHSGQMKGRAGKNKQDATGAVAHDASKRRYTGFNERWDAAEAAGDAPLTRNLRSVWDIQTQPYAEAHFAVFPEELPRKCILAGCPAGGIVLDPFMGSGTTAKVARDLARKAVGVELNPEYAELCARRLAQQSLLAEDAA